MKVYVASSWRNAFQPSIITILRAAGLEVYDFRNPEPNSAFTWKSIALNPQDCTPQQWRTALSHPVAQSGYQSDRSGMDWADCCVLVLPCGRSAHLEAGFMAGQGKPVFTLALEPIEPELMSLLLGPPDAICTSVEELLTCLGVSEKVHDRIDSSNLKVE